MKISVKAENIIAVDESDPHHQIGTLKAQMSGFASNLNRILNISKSDDYKLKVVKVAVEEFIKELEAQDIKVMKPSSYQSRLKN